MDRTLLLEAHLKEVAKRPQRKNEDTITKFNRDIFWYNRDMAKRHTNPSVRVTYEDHRKAVETAVNFFRKDTQHDIAMCILTHRYFSDYRSNALSGAGNFLKDYTFLVKKTGMLFNPTASRIAGSNVSSQLSAYKDPTLVQINHICGAVTPVTPPSDRLSLSEWAKLYNDNAVESTTYQVAGLRLGA